MLTNSAIEIPYTASCAVAKRIALTGAYLQKVLHDAHGTDAQCVFELNPDPVSFSVRFLERNQQQSKHHPPLSQEANPYQVDIILRITASVARFE